MISAFSLYLTPIQINDLVMRDVTEVLFTQLQRCCLRRHVFKRMLLRYPNPHELRYVMDILTTSDPSALTSPSSPSLPALPSADAHVVTNGAAPLWRNPFPRSA